MTSKSLKTLVPSILILAAMGCKVRDPRPFDPYVYQQAQRTRAAEVKAQPLPAMPTELRSPFADQATTQPTTRPDAPELGEVLPEKIPSIPAGRDIRLPLREIVQRGTINSTDVRVAAYSPAIEETRVVEEEAVFDPAFFSNVFYDRQDNPTAGTIPDVFNPDPFFREKSESILGAVGVRKRLQTGGTAELSYQVSRSEFDPARTFFDPYYQNDLILEIQQPLLRNLGVATNRARINITRNNQRISLYDFREAVEENAALIEQAYWQLYAALEEVRIQQDLLEDTMRTGVVLYRRFIGGFDVSRLQTAQAAASYQSRRASLVRAEARVRDLSDEIKRRMNEPDFPVTSAGIVIPSDAPLVTPISFDLADQIDTALENRLELAQQQLRIESAGIASRVAKNGLLPQLNLVTAFSVRGVGEDLGDSTDQQADFNRFGSRIGFEFEVPIGNRGPRALYRRSLLQRQQAIEQYRSLVDQISQEVAAAVREVETSWREIVTTREAYDAANDALRAIRQREEANEPLVPTFVQLKLDTQELVGQTARAYTNSIANYNIGISRLERAKGTLLRYNNIVLEQIPTPFDAVNP